MPASRADARTLPPDAAFTRWQAPDGWSLRRFDRPASGGAGGSILFQGGRGDMPEKYLESFAHWHRRGWNVTSLDWRGQAGSGRCGRHDRCGHIESFDAYLHDFEVFVREWRGTVRGPHVVVGHSMGGHLLLRALAGGQVACDGAILSAPMLGLKGPVSPGFAERLARTIARLGRRDRPAWKGNERPRTIASRQSLLTHDADRYADELHWHDADPGLVTGPPSWAWLVEAFASTRLLRTDLRVADIEIPVLALVAEADGLVDPAAALSLLARLPDATIVRFGRESAHEILRELDAVRDRALAAIDSFLDERIAHA